MTRAGFTFFGVECPECGSILTSSRRAGLDGAGQRIRVRQCRTCEHRFNTVEVPAQFVFNRLDATNEPKTYATKAGSGHLAVTVTVVDPPRKTTCRKGLHVMDDANTYVAKVGSRHCRACKRLAGDKYRIYARDYLRTYKREWSQQRAAARRKPAA